MILHGNDDFLGTVKYTPVKFKMDLWLWTSDSLILKNDSVDKQG